MTKWVGWSPHNHGWYELKTNGYLKPDKNIGGEGEVLDGNWGLGGFHFSVNLGTCSTTEVELWALIHGLWIGWAGPAMG